MPYITIDEAKRKKIPRNNLQTILIPRDNDLDIARKWLKKHKYKVSHRTTTHFYRFMQNNPIIGAAYYTKVLPNKIELIFQKY